MIRVPIMPLVGDEDTEGTQMMAQRLHGLISGSKFMVMNGAHPIANMSKSDDFKRAVRDFLSSS